MLSPRRKECFLWDVERPDFHLFYEITGVFSREKIYLFGISFRYPARPVSLLVVTPLFLDRFMAISVEMKEPRSCRLEEFRPDVLEGLFSPSSGKNGFLPLVRRYSFSFLHSVVTIHLSNQLPYLCPKGVLCRALRLLGLKSICSLGGLALFLFSFFQATLVILSFSLRLRLGFFASVGFSV